MMKLGEAIRLGASMHPQAFGVFFADAEGAGVNTVGEIAFTCALGGALVAVGDAAGDWPFLALHRRWKRTLSLPAASPCECSPTCLRETGYGVVRELIAHLNNTHRWSREAIADWVELQELQLIERSAEELPASAVFVPA